MVRTDARGAGPVLHQSDGADDERGPRGPGQRALQAMAEAVRRAREVTEPVHAGMPGPPHGTKTSNGKGGRSSTSQPGHDESEPTLMPVESGVGPTLVPTETIPTQKLRYPPAAPPRATAQETARVGPSRPGPTTKTPLRWAVVAVGVIVLLLSAVVIVLNTTSHSPVSSPSVPQVTPARPTIPPTKSSSATTAPPRPTTKAPTTTAPTLISPVVQTPGSAPELTSLVPAEGSAGQSVVISGANLFSSDGLVQASFDGEAAPTSCPNQSSCTVVVPFLSGLPRAVQVTVTTESGTSNAVSFYYG